MNTKLDLLEIKPLVFKLSQNDRWLLLKFLIELLRPENIKNSVLSDRDLGWTPGFFERTAGLWQGEPLERGDQGEYDKRDWSLL